MSVSLLVFRIMALLYLSAGIAAVTGNMTFQKIADDFKKSPALTFVTGFISLVVGMILVHYHNVWVKNWTVLVTMIGWAALLKGVMLIVYPKSVGNFKKFYTNSVLWGLCMIALGLVFGYVGFIR